MSSNFSRVRAENQFVFLNTGQIFGINSLNITNNFGPSPIKYVGMGSRNINQSVNSTQYADLSISSNFIQEDIFIQQTGKNPINFFIFQDTTDVNSCYSLISGYLTTYSAKYISNQVPQINSTLRFYYNAGNISQKSLDSYSSGQITNIISNTYASFNNNVADSNYINLVINEGQTNRVLDYTFSIEISRLPIYNIGSRSPKRVDIIFPINITCNITFEAAQSFVDSSLTDFPLNKTVQNLELDVYSNRTDNLMANYYFQNMTMVSNEKNLTTENNLLITRKYVGQILNFIDGQISPINWDFGFVASGINFYMDWGNTNLPIVNQYDFGGLS